mmetsp:Transcript_17674/g.53897  ORF Transcript_17674/g.53897 Transcript_17674/m.53897 type:complete len:683 (-) Transcript_17674:1202-3250(-)
MARKESTWVSRRSASASSLWNSASKAVRMRRRSSSSRAVPRPELQIVKAEDGSVASDETLPMRGFELCGGADYSLASNDEFRLPRTVATAGAASWKREDHRLLDDDLRAVEPSPSLRGEPPRTYVACPYDVVVARVRDVDDVIDFALKKSPQRKAKDALAVATAHAHRLKRHRVQDLVKSRLDALLADRELETAATECRRLLGDAETLWEYWILVFDKHGALASLAPHIPVRKPRLATGVYDMVLERLLATDPEALRDTLRKWAAAILPSHVTPASASYHYFYYRGLSKGGGGDESKRPLYSVDALLSTVEAAGWTPSARDSVLSSSRSHSNDKRRAAVVEAAAELYVAKDEPDKALACLLSLEPGDLSDPNVVFDLLDARDLYHSVRHRVADLARVSRDRAADVLVRRVDTFPIDAVADQLETDPDLQLWYLTVLFDRAPDSYASPDHKRLHAKYVTLYAERNAGSSRRTKVIAEKDKAEKKAADAPDASKAAEETGEEESELLRFLKWSTFVPLDAALASLERTQPPMYDEIVYVLGRMGDHKRGLRILLEHVDSVKRAVDFVEVHDKDLWDDLIAHALKNDRFLSGLLDYADVSVKLIEQIPDGMRIPGLKHKLIKILDDHTFQLLAYKCCAKAASADCLHNLKQLYALQNQGLVSEPPHDLDPDHPDRFIVRPRRRHV